MALFLENFADLLRQIVCISSEVRTTDFDRVVSGKRRDVARQLASLGHTSAFDEYRNDWDIPIQCRRNLDPYVIVGLVEPTATILILGVKPVRADGAEENVATFNLLAQMFHEIRAGRHVVHIDEEIRFTEFLNKPIIEPARHGSGIVTAIADKILLAMAPRRVHLTTGVRYRAQRLTLNLGKSGRFPTEASGLATFGLPSTK